MKPIAICALALLLLAATALAADNQTQRNDLEARYLHLSCRADLIKAQAEILGTSANATLPDETIATNMEKLKQYVDANDVKGFNTYVKTTLTTSYKTFNTQLINARNQWRTMNMSRTERREGFVSAIGSWKSAVAAFADCNSQAQRKIVEVREAQITRDMERWTLIVADLKAKGLNVTALEEVLADAEQLRTMLADAKATENITEFQAKVEELRQLHLHLWARFNIGRIESHLQYIEGNATTTQQTEQVRQIKSMMNSSKAIAAKGNSYVEGEFEQTWQNIFQAGEKLKGLAKSIKGDEQ